MLNWVILNNFRNYDKRRFSFAEKNLIIGKNGAGKSNLLEAIRLTSILKSSRVKKEDEMIREGEDILRVEAKFGNKNISIAFGRQEKKKAQKNGVDYKLTELVGEIPTVLFEPTDLSLCDGSPSLRRRFLNTLLSQQDKIFLNAFIRYKKILKQRNKLLFLIKQERANKKDLAVWNQPLVELGQEIQKKNSREIERINQALIGIGKSFVARKFEVQIIKQQKKITLQELLRREEQDINKGYTGIGPHLDDFIFQINKQPLRIFGSRGQKRLAIIILKSAEIKLLKQKNKRTVFLLDDIFSELDSRFREKIVFLIEGVQTIITSADKGIIPSKLLKSKATKKIFLTHDGI